MGRLKLTIEEMQKIAKSRGGKCLSMEYINSKINLQWQCKKEHIWWATPNNIKQRRWCPYCAGRIKLTIEELQEIAKNRGGKCLSIEYINSNIKLEWECSKGHTWLATPSKIKIGRWCPKCGIKQRANKRRLTIDEMQEIAESRCGKCLSTKYVNQKIKLEWECKDGHTWLATPSHIKRGRWCPKCNTLIGEKIFRHTLTCIFQKYFQKIRPKWLKGNYKKSLELDAYNEELKLAGEYNGIYWHKEEKRKINDKLTAEGCKKHDITLLTVNARNDYENIINDIITECDICNVTLPDPICYIYYKDLPIYLPSKLMKMQQIAESRDGKCLSKEYVNNSTKLEWECTDGHRWLATPSDIKGKHWCPECYNNRRGDKLRLTIEEMQEIAESRCGKCLSTEYINIDTKLEWQCGEGHRWLAIPYSVKKGHWCPECYNNRRKRREKTHSKYVIALKEKK